MIRKTIHIQNHDKEDIYIDIRHREDAREAPAVFIIHGFKGFKNWAFFPDLSDRLAMDGYVTITPNFSRNGIGYDYNTFEFLDKFAENTLSHELNDLQIIIDHVKEEKIAKRTIDVERLGILGHSRGGVTAILKAAELNDDIKCLITWAAPSTLLNYSDAQIAQWKKDGFIEIENSRTKQKMRINKGFWDDLNKNKSAFDVLKAIENYENPSLFLHGNKDETVDFSHSEKLYEHCSAYAKRCEIIENATHTFGIPHPMQKETEEYQSACLITENWFDNYLNV